MMARTSLATRAAVLLVAATIAYAYFPFVRHTDLLGRHDWDQMEAHRYLVQKSILHYHQFPFWNPYACGGFDAWGGLESDTVVITPWIFGYLIFPLGIAIRMEILGTTIVSAVGAWLLASRFVRSPALKALVTILWVVNVRHLLQLNVGHTWHLSYAWVPWVFYFFERASEKLTARNVAGGAIALAMMLYSGAIYPLPQVALVLVLYACARAVTGRTLRPIVAVAATGLLGMALSAPKLVPQLAVIRRFPRLVSSDEIYPLGVLFDSVVQRAHQDEAYKLVATQGWHEYGMYLGAPVVAWLLWGAFANGGRRAAHLKWIALGVLAVSLGAVGKAAPWTLLHKLPIFSSQHVPMRWLYFAILPAALAAAMATQLAVAKLRRIGPWVEAVMLLAVAFVAIDIAPIVHRLAIVTFVHAPAGVVESFGPIRTYRGLPTMNKYDPGSYGYASLPAEIRNIATTDCNMFPGLANPNRPPVQHTPGLGAVASNDPHYRGEAWVEGGGTAEITRFSPNAIDVTIHGATPGARVVLDQNWDDGWTADGRPIPNRDDLVWAPAPSGDATIHFSYTPRGFWSSVLLALVALATAASMCFKPGLCRALLLGRRRSRNASSAATSGASTSTS
ncbi:MAG TPA: hypothetical protein VH054_00650 [Polyangiaceae bacterium]|jgi:hypothetical protein|nr:hypothetical protein [Polyangiaceae bacterium]